MTISYRDSKVLFLYTYVSDVKKYKLEAALMWYIEKVHREIFKIILALMKFFWIFSFGFSLWDFTYKKSRDIHSRLYVERIAINFRREDLSSCQRNPIA